MNNSNKLQEKFLSDGFVLVKGLLSNKTIFSELLESVFTVYSKYNKSTKLTNIDEPWLTEEFYKEFIEYREKNPEDFSAMYDSIQTNVILDKFLTDDSIVDIVATLLNTTKQELSITGRQLRIDVPLDERNKVNWHQDISRFRNEGLVVWFPLVDVPSETGALVVCPKGHHAGDVVVETKAIESYETTRQYEIKQEFIEKYDQLQIPMEKGDVLFFDINMIHKSGDNISKKIRFSTQGRFSVITSEKFLPFGEARSYNPYIAKKLGRHLYDQ